MSQRFKMNITLLNKKRIAIRKTKQNRENGFTLIELIVVIAVIGIMSAVALPAFLNVVGTAHEANIDAVTGVITHGIVLSASDSLATNGLWRTPLANQVTIANMSLKVSSEWSDNGAGVWIYAPTGGTVTYTRVSNDDFTITVAY